MKTFKNILVIGDNHDHWEVFPNIIRDYGLDNCAVILAGDFGIGFEPFNNEMRKVSYLSKRMAYTNSVLFVVRGNHDNPEYFTGIFDTDNVKLVPDYTVLNINGINILCVGGAFSIDRTIRKSYFNFNNTKSGVISKNDYWPNEMFIYDHDKIMSMKNINMVVTHSAPKICPPYIKNNLKFWSINDKNIIEDCNIERSQLFQIYDNLIQNGNNISHWFYGHFHNHYKTPYHNTIFIGLDINDLAEMNF